MYSIDGEKDKIMWLIRVLKQNWFDRSSKQFHSGQYIEILESNAINKWNEASIFK